MADSVRRRVDYSGTWESDADMKGPVAPLPEPNRPGLTPQHTEVMSTASYVHVSGFTKGGAENAGPEND